MGEIIVSTDAARKNARQYGTTSSHELILYVIHGILHLTGYDDQRPAQRLAMRRREEQMMEYLQKKKIARACNAA